MNFCKSSSQVYQAELKSILPFESALSLLFVTLFVSTFFVDVEAVERAATIAEAEGVNKIEATHLERILPQLLLDF